MPDFDYDFIVIGGGSGGVRAARMAASFGARTVIIEGARLGGTCVNVGCVPKKLFAYGSHYSEHLEDMRGFGWSVEGEPGFDWSVMKARKDTEILRLNGIYETILDNADVEIVRGWATFADPHTVEVDGRKLTGRYVLIAVGGKPWRPDEGLLPGVEYTWTSDHVFELEALPDRVLVVGGGYIACEMASILHGFGVETHLAYRGEMLLRGFDQDVRHEVGNELRKRGLHLHFNCMPAAVQKTETGCLHVKMDDTAEFDVDAVLMATGRVPRTGALGLDAIGVQTGERGAVVVNDAFQTTVPHIYAVGDVIDRLQLTPVALAEGMVVARSLFAKVDPGSVDYAFVPTAVFTDPEVGTVGYTEEAALRHFGKIRLYKSSFRPMKHTITKRNSRTHMKLIVDDATDRVVGLHIVGPDAAEMTQGFAVAMRCGATKHQFDTTIGIHPTAAEELVTMRTEWVPVADDHPPRS
ncbi:MAG: glutathione-disulfide reductase [Myxococcota bacterium]